MNTNNPPLITYKNIIASSNLVKSSIPNMKRIKNPNVVVITTILANNKIKLDITSIFGLIPLTSKNSR